MEGLSENQRENVVKIVSYMAKQDPSKATEISAIATDLFDELGERDFKKAIIFYIYQHHGSLASNYHGPNIIRKGIHIAVQRFINALYRRAVRDFVMMPIYKFIEDYVPAGDLLRSLQQPDDCDRFLDSVTRSETAKEEEKFVRLTQAIKTKPGALNKIVQAINNNQFDDFELLSSDDEDNQARFISLLSDEEDEVPSPKIQRKKHKRVGNKIISLISDDEDELQSPPRRKITTRKRSLKRDIAYAPAPNEVDFEVEILSSPQAPRKKLKETKRKNKLAPRVLDLVDDDNDGLLDEDFE